MKMDLSIRGHQSHIGVGFVTEVCTGIIVDFEVLRNHCKVCEIDKSRKHKCHKNFDGKAGAMETEEAKRMWLRSLDYGFRYVTFVGDGDSSAFKGVTGLNEGSGPYGDVVVKKEECINHVHKRMGARLTKAKAHASEIITTKTGKMQRRSFLGGQNMLTKDVIICLQSYYGLAIRNNKNTDVKSMQKAIWASFYHLSSTDEKPQHKLCPQGIYSWCFYNRAVAEGVASEPHAAKNLYLAKIPFQHLDHIKNVYRDLSSPDLLARCLRGWTQNPNESLHSKLWQKCPKIKCFGLFRVIFAVQVTVLDHNFGYDKCNLLEHLFGTNKFVQKGQAGRERRRRMIAETPKRTNKKRKLGKSAEYKTGTY